MITITPVDRAADLVVAVLSNAPAGLFTDIDGTISHVARTPSEATVDEAARISLRRLAKNLAIVGAVTGRGAADAAGMLELNDIALIGNHGYERIEHGARIIHPSALGSRAGVAACAAAIRTIVEMTPRLAGVVVEDKDLSASVHYRLVEDQGRTIELLEQLVRAVSDLHDLTVTNGKLVYEIRPRAVVNKGTAIHDISVELDLAGIVYLGDDVTDVDAFRVLTSLASDKTKTLSVGIVSSETHQVVLETADIFVEGVDGCIELLGAVADRLAPSVD